MIMPESPGTKSHTLNHCTKLPHIDVNCCYVKPGDVYESWSKNNAAIFYPLNSTDEEKIQIKIESLGL